MDFNWSCPFCDRAQTVVDKKYGSVSEAFHTSGSLEGPLGIWSQAIVCANPECKRTTVTAHVVECKKNAHGYLVQDTTKHPLTSKRLVPEGNAKPIPSFVPEPIREDYGEACLIQSLSPKASATLSRRYLQGMIRDFANVRVKGNKLFQEIAALRQAVDAGTAPRDVSEASVEAIDAARLIGNIGAHMEADIGVIVDVDLGEAGVLIELIESLIEDWYINRERRAARFAKAISVAEDKKAALKAPSAHAQMISEDP